MPGQGQTIRVAGMRVGDLGEVELENGVAVVKLEFDPEYDDLVRADATALLRPRTGLKDMFLELDPGTKAAPALEEGDTIPVVNTAPDVNADEVLSALDDDTRDYLRLLLTGAGGGLERRGGDLREVFRRLGPLHRHLAELNGKLKTRRTAARAAGPQLRRDVRGARDEGQGAVAARRRLGEDLRRARGRGPEHLRGGLAPAHDARAGGGDAAHGGRARSGGRAGVRGAAPGRAPAQAHERRDQAVRRGGHADHPRSACGRSSARRGPTSAISSRPRENLHSASPDLRASFFELNRLFNMLSYNPGGHEELDTSGTAEAHNANRQRDEGFLFWLAWVAQNTTSIMSTGDAQGNFRRFTVSASCSTIRGLVQDEPALELLLGVTALLNDPGLCPAA